MSAYVECGHCGMFHAGPCPRIKSVEYYPDGRVKRVEYMTAADQQPKLVEAPFNGTMYEPMRFSPSTQSNPVVEAWPGKPVTDWTD